ncbi:Hypothetical predicted protein [Prunus dulcis]|uniref:Uncharacterized protein n=1 Tax=Prunus dulcis TaxID=3755 RepID=A0A5E4EIE3_PRUDU|nr:Hypothetical predicted protein [Prunus dulcis]
MVYLGDASSLDKNQNGVVLALNGLEEGPITFSKVCRRRGGNSGGREAVSHTHPPAAHTAQSPQPSKLHHRDLNVVAELGCSLKFSEPPVKLETTIWHWTYSISSSF